MHKYTEEKSFRLITIPISHYCEKVRWALDRLHIPYTEEGHAPLFHRLATKRSGGGQTVPVLVTDKGTFSDSTDILHYLDGIATAETKLYPTDSKLRYEVEKLEDLFDQQLGPSIRQWAYFYTIDNRKLLLKAWCRGVPLVERTLLAIVFPLIRSAAQRKINITVESAGESLETIKRIFNTVNEQLADGRTYLVGDRFSAADLTFAALAAPVLRPKEYSVQAFQLDELPNEMAATIKELRKTPAGKYVLRLFREERRPQPRLNQI